jgi:hypothetical protein
MKKLFGGTLVIWSLLAIAPAAGFADSGRTSRIERSHSVCSNVKYEPKFRRWHQVRGEKAEGVPELDPSVAGQALAVVIGGSAVLLGKARKRARSK